MNWPRFIAHYFTRDFGSNFTIVPWLGYPFFGGILGYLLHRRPQWAFSHWLPLLLMAFGWTLHYGSHQMLVNLYNLTGWENFPILFNNNYLFWRLGHVLIVMSIFMWVLPRVGKVPALLSKVGSETLTIYAGHYILLYGTWLGIGLSQIIGYRTLGPISTIIGAIAFVALFVIGVKYIEEIREWAYVRVPNWLFYRWRLFRVWLRRELPKPWIAFRRLSTWLETVWQRALSLTPEQSR